MTIEVEYISLYNSVRHDIQDVLDEPNMLGRKVLTMHFRELYAHVKQSTIDKLRKKYMEDGLFI